MSSMVESRNFIRFCMPPNIQLEDKAGLNEWMERMMFLFEDLKWLLSQKCDVFWSQIVQIVPNRAKRLICLSQPVFVYSKSKMEISGNEMEIYSKVTIKTPERRRGFYSGVSIVNFEQFQIPDGMKITLDESWHPCFESFLQHAPRSFDLNNLPVGCKTALSRISRMYLLVIKRMSLFDEENVFPSQAEYGNFIYQNYHFDAAKLMDICAIFYRPDCGVQKILKEIFQNIFESQPSYYDDFSNILSTIISTIDTMEQRMSDKTTGPMREREAQDMISFTYDMTKTIENLQSVHPDISYVFLKAKFVNRLVHFAENMLPSLLKLVTTNRRKFLYMKKEIENGLLLFLSKIVQIGFIKRVEEKRQDIDVQEVTTDYIEVLGDLTQHPKFLQRYCELGTIYEEIATISKWDCVDVSSLDYIRSMLPIASNKPEKQSVLSQLKELLPHKSESFLQACIEKYGNNIDEIINKVMEANITNEFQLRNNEQDKKPIVIPDKDILDDNKAHVKLLKDTYLRNDGYSHDEGKLYDMYEDEYDDTYDSQNIAAQDADSADEYTDINARRKFTIPNILRQAGDVTPPDSDSEGDETPKNREKEENGTKKKSDNKLGNGNFHRGGNNQGNNRRGDSRAGGRGNNNRGKNRGNRNNRYNEDRRMNNEERRRYRNDRRQNEHRGNDDENRDNENRDEENPNADQIRNDDGRNQRDGGHRRGGGRGRGRGNPHNRRSLADKKRSRGMMPF